MWVSRVIPGRRMPRKVRSPFGSEEARPLGGRLQVHKAVLDTQQRVIQLIPPRPISDEPLIRPYRPSVTHAFTLRVNTPSVLLPNGRLLITFP